jgi:hypothetical protein
LGKTNGRKIWKGLARKSMNRKLKIMNRIYKRLHVANRIPEQIKEFSEVQKNGEYIGIAMIK